MHFVLNLCINFIIQIYAIVELDSVLVCPYLLVTLQLTYFCIWLVLKCGGH